MARRTTLALVGALALATHAAAQPSTNLADYVLFATDVIKTKAPAIAGGDVGVNELDGRLVASRTFTAPSSVVAADRVRFDREPSNTVLQQLYANTVEVGPLATPFATPIITNVAVACGYPNPFPQCEPSNPVDVLAGATTTLGPGAYGAVRVRGATTSAGVLVLTGGSYAFCDVKLSRNTELRVQAPATIAVAGKASFGPNSLFGPNTGSGLAASDIRLHAAGRLVKLSRGSFSEAHMCAPDAKLKMSQGGTHVGVHAARYIRTQQVTLDLGSPSGAFVDSDR